MWKFGVALLIIDICIGLVLLGLGFRTYFDEQYKVKTYVNGQCTVLAANVKREKCFRSVGTGKFGKFARNYHIDSNMHLFKNISDRTTIHHLQTAAKGFKMEKFYSSFVFHIY